MQILQKNNNVRFLSLILGIFILIVSCSKIENKTINENIKYSINSDILNSKIVVLKDSDVYKIIDNKKIVVGNVYTNSILDLSNKTFDDLIKIQDTDLYIKQDNIQKSDRWYRKNTHLIPFDKVIKPKSTYTLYDKKGNKIITLNNYKATYSIFVLENEDNRYGILFQNELAYINKEDIEEIFDNQNSTIKKGENISVLMYHFFYDESQGENGKDNNFIEVKVFDEQMFNLVEKGYTTLTMEEVYYYILGLANIPEKSVAITIDDGDPSVYKYAYPILKNYSLNATLFLITGQEDPTLNYNYIQMREDGLELQSHSWQMHQGGCSGMGHGGRLLCTSYEEGVKDTKMSFNYVDGGFVYCYPFGDYNDLAKTIIKDGGAKMAFTTKYGKIHKGMDLLELPRIRVNGNSSIETFLKSIE